jgi:molecular chaperone DnaJ
MSKLNEYFKQLNVSEKATDAEIKKAYNRKIRECHPDLYPNDPVKFEQFNKLNNVYDSIKDKQSREKTRKTSMGNQINQSPKGGGRNSNQGINFDFFSDFFNFDEVSENSPEKTYELELTLNQIFKGTDKKIKIKQQKNCDCSRGYVPTGKICQNCAGRGVVFQKSSFMSAYTASCSGCRGTGRQLLKCPTCKGTYRLTYTAEHNISIPPGVKQGQVFREKGLNFKIKVKTAEYQVNWTTLVVTGNLEISLKTALLGGEISFKNFDESVLKVKIPCLTSSETRVRIKQKGLIISTGGWFIKTSKRSDLVLRLKINLDLSSAIRTKLCQIL